jgi:hypothetical protein
MFILVPLKLSKDVKLHKPKVFGETLDKKKKKLPEAEYLAVYQHLICMLIVISTEKPVKLVICSIYTQL